MKKRKRRINIRKLFEMIIFEILFIGITGYMIMLYGPFDNIKRTFVGTAMNTTTHQYFATLFLSKEKIAEIMGKDTETSDTQNIKDVEIKHKADNTIKLYNVTTSRFDGYIMEIHDPKRLKVGVTSKIGVRGETTSEIAKENGAIAAVNGGGFTDKSTKKLWVGTGANPAGLVISEGRVICNTYGSNDSFQAIAFNKEGDLIVGTHTLKNLLAQGVVEALSFNKTLIINGKPQIKDSAASFGIEPRTAIAQKQDGTVMLLVIDGRRGYKQGATLREVQDLLLKNGAWNAANLDGGSSSTMYYDGDLVNNPCDSDGERTIATAFYVTP